MRPGVFQVSHSMVKPRLLTTAMHPTPVTQAMKVMLRMRRTQAMKPMNQTQPTSTLAILQQAAAVLIKGSPQSTAPQKAIQMQTAYSVITASAAMALCAKTTMKTSPAKNVHLRSCAFRQNLRLKGQIGPLDLRANVPRLLTVRNFPVVLRPAPHSLVVDAQADVEPTMTVVKTPSVDSGLASKPALTT